MRGLSKALLVAAVALAALPAVASAEGDGEDSGLHPKVKMETSLGDIVLQLDGEKAPISTMNFIQYAQDGYYNGTVFHRVIPTFMIQGGGFTTELDQKTEGLRPGIVNEWQNGLKNVRGSIAMARIGGQPDSATSQFFINVVDNPNLDRPGDGAAYAVFGKVVEGMDTVDKIRDTETTTSDKYPGGKVVPKEAVVIKSVTVVGDYNKDAIQAKAEDKKQAAEKAEAQANAEKEKELQKLIDKVKEETGNEIVTTASGLKYAEIKEGEGETPSASDTVSVHYTGWLVDGTKFDSSHDRGTPATFPLGGVIKGWTEGVGSMKVGGKRKLIIPPDLGYGKRGFPPRIPPESWLVFEVELLGIEK